MMIAKLADIGQAGVETVQEHILSNGEKKICVSECFVGIKTPICGYYSPCVILNNWKRREIHLKKKNSIHFRHSWEGCQPCLAGTGGMISPC